MSIDRDEIAGIQDEALRKALELNTEEYAHLEEALEELKRRRAIERLEQERGM
uniref:Uncharacterized protein n=1 Tax=viral metagenome TaxID=1070528 RepID=A0A6M3IGX4_9ZZZZ